MGLDVYVMPLWRFKVGDFRSPIEDAIGLRPKIMTSDGIEERPKPSGWIARWRARREVAAVRKAVEATNRTPARWNDEGEVVFSQQSAGFEPLQAYAAWLDCRDRIPEFEPPPDRDYGKHPAMLDEGPPLACPHLVGHDCFAGYFLPCEFERLVEVEPYLIHGEWPASRRVGSSPRLVRELDAIQELLRVPDDWPYPQDDPLGAVKAAYLQLRTVAELSCRHGLPIIFWG
jgi:hypothetical protein